MPHENSKTAYERLRAAHLSAVQASVEDHVTRLDWPHQRIEDYQTAKLRSLLGFARERSPFHAARMADIDRFTELLLTALDESGYIKPGTEVPTQEKVRRRVRRLKLPAEDAKLWLGILRQILWKLRHK